MTGRAVLASVAALAIAGCGGSSEPLEKLRAQAGRVCTTALDAGALVTPPRVPSDTSAFLRRGVAVLRPELAGLRRLRAPSEEAGAYSAALASLARELTILTDTAHDLDRGADPMPTIKTLQRRLAPVEADGNAAWRTLGVPGCVNR
jgi:hypothetical protein